MPDTTFRIWRGSRGKGEFADYKTEITEGMVVLDAMHQIQAEQRERPGGALELQGGQVRLVLGGDQRQAALMCMTRMDELPANEPVTVEPMRAFPHVRDLVTDVSWNFEVKKKIKPFTPRKPDAPDGTWRMAAGRTSTACRSSASASSASCARTSATCCATTTSTTSSSARGSSCTRAALEMHPLDTEDRLARPEGRARHRLLQHHQVLHEGLSRAHHDHRQRDHPAEGARGR